MQNKLLLTFIVILVLSFNQIFAQSKKSIKDSTSVIIFNQSSTSASNKRKSAGEDNIIKIAPLGFLSGTFPILFERKITDFLSLQASGGLTSKNYVRSLITKESNPVLLYPWEDDNISDESEHLYSFDYRKPKIGFMAGIQPRIYFESEGLEGPFLGLAFDYYNYKFEVPGFSGSAGNYEQDGPMLAESEKIKDFMVHFGNQTLYDKITLEFSSAIGIRNVSGDKYVAGSDANNQLKTGMATYKQTLLNFNVGIKVGYHF